MPHYCFHTVQEKKTLQKLSLHRAINFLHAKWKTCFFAQVYLLVSSHTGLWIQNHSWKRTLSPLDSLVIGMLCKRFAVLQDLLTPIILNMVIISSTTCDPAGAIEVHCCVHILDTPSSGAPNFRIIFEDSETRTKHPSTIKARVYSKNTSWIVKSLWILDWTAATEVVFWRRLIVSPGFYYEPDRRLWSI